MRKQGAGQSGMGFFLLQSAHAKVARRLMWSKLQMTQARFSSILAGKCLSLYRIEGGANVWIGRPSLFLEQYWDNSSSDRVRNSGIDCVCLVSLT